ncbi:MAG: restriction endonuclease subunit S [Planctomycetales bacterium]|nr:restriction endonuclease subunit S [Planctomycetales bacterium]
MNYAKLSDVAPAKASDHRPRHEDVVWHLGLEQIESGTGVIHERNFLPAREAGSSTFVFDQRNVLYSKLRPYLNKVVCPDSIGIATSELVPLRPDPSKLDRRYLCYYLRSLAFVSWISDKVAGAKMPRAKMDAFWKHEIPLPPLEDQKRIAYLLSKVEGLIAQRKQHLQQLDDLLKSVFHDMFGPSSPRFSEWPMVPISELAASDRRSMRTGPFGSNLLHSEFNEDGDVAVLGIDNAVNNKFEWGQRRFITLEKYEQLKNYRIYPGDVIITIMGTIGRSAVIPEDIPLAINTKHLAAITVNRRIANPTYLSYSIHSSPHIQKQLASKDRGAIMSGLNLTLIKETLIPRPSVDLQDEFARIHDRTQTLQGRLRVTIDRLQTLYDALANLAFEGELDLSRTTAIAESIEGEPENETDKPTTIEELPFELPTPTKSILDDSARVNQEALHTWLTAYCQHKGRQRISADEFLKLVDKKLMDMSIERNAEWLPQSVDLSTYEQVRKWIFEELKYNRLKQDYDNESNRIRVLATKD